MTLFELIQKPAPNDKYAWVGIIHPVKNIRHVIGLGNRPEGLPVVVEKYCPGALDQEVLETFSTMEKAVEWSA